MSKGSRKHTHKYHRVDLNFARVWACALPECNHHMPAHYTALVVGKRSYCWQCGKEFLLDGDAMIEDKPRCVECRLGVSLEEIDNIPVSAALQKYLDRKVS